MTQSKTKMYETAKMVVGGSEVGSGDPTLGQGFVLLLETVLVSALQEIFLSVFLLCIIHIFNGGEFCK